MMSRILILDPCSVSSRHAHIQKIFLGGGGGGRGGKGSSFGPRGIRQFYHFKTHTLGNRGGGPDPRSPPLDPRMADELLKHFQSPVGLVLNINVGSFKPCSHRRCNRLATVSRLRQVKIADRLQGRRKVLLKSVTSRLSVADQPPSMSNLNQSLAVFWTCTKDGPRLILVAKKFQWSPIGHRLVADATDRRLVGDWLATDRRLKWNGDLLPTSPVGD